MNSTLSPRQIVGVYATPGDDEYDDIYIVFRSGVTMYCDYAMSVLEALNNSMFEWQPSIYGEQHVREIFEFIGYFPAPCEEQI